MIPLDAPYIKPPESEVLSFVRTLPPSTYETLCEAAEAKWGRITPEMLRVFDRTAVQSSR